MACVFNAMQVSEDRPHRGDEIEAADVAQGPTASVRERREPSLNPSFVVVTKLSHKSVDDRRLF